MLHEWKDKLIGVITSRLFILGIVLAILYLVLIHRVFVLQIVNGEDYLNNFQLQIEKQKSIASTRGNIYDRNGNVLAYNELAYSVTIEDVYEAGKTKNDLLNATIYQLIQMVESNGDAIITDFFIYVDEDNRYTYSVTGTSLLRFLADIYGYSYTSQLSYAESTATPDEVMAYLCSSDRYKIGSYNEQKEFLPQEGYSKSEILKMVTIRYAISTNSYKKYIATTVATDVSDETVAMIMENEDILDGVTIMEDTVRRYVDSVYFSHILGYTGKISSEELATFSQYDDTYTMNDMVGKAGIESVMEIALHGTKGSETIFVNNLGKIIETTEYIEPIAGNNLYLTIDRDLQISTYSLLEQKLAGILVDKIQNVKTFDAEEASEIIIPIYDVYFALINNTIIDIRKFNDSEYATETSKAVYASFLEKQASVMQKLEEELVDKETPYNQLTKEYKIYQSYIVSMLQSDSKGVLVSSLVDRNDATYLDWTVNEVISLKEYLLYAISMNWIDVTKLPLEGDYYDSAQIYEALVPYILDTLQNTNEFSKKMYKYMLYDNEVSGRQICQLLWEQEVIEVEDERLSQLLSGEVSAFDFMVDLIATLKITPAQLALDPCSASCVITDANNGDILALVSYPGYDTNRLANTVDTAYYNQLNSDLSLPLWNYATQQRTAPGSTFKLITAVAALEEGVVTAKEKILCEGIFEKLTATIQKCWIYPGGHGRIDMATAISVSCNSYFYEVAFRMSQSDGSYDSDAGLLAMEKYAEQFGLTETSGVEIVESSPRFSTEYSVPSAIGQGKHSYTTVGLARYVTTVANKGTCYQLTLLDRLTDTNGLLLEDYAAEVRNTVTLDDSIWNILYKGMYDMVQSKSYLRNAGFLFAGKTGTAQENTSRANHALFIGFAPYDAPQIAIATRIGYGYTSSNASEVSKKILQYYFGVKDQEELLSGTADEALPEDHAGD